VVKKRRKKIDDPGNIIVKKNRRELAPQEMLKLLFDYAEKIANEKDLNHLLVYMADLGRALTVADRCTLWLLDEESKELWTKVAHGVDEIRIPMHAGLAGRVIKSGGQLIIDDAYEDPDFNRETDKKTGYRTKAVMGIPLKGNEDQIMGVYQALNKMTDEEKFSTTDLEHLTLAASYSAKSIESAMLYQEIEETQKEIIFTMGAIGENRSLETANHVRRVAEYSKVLALGYGLSAEDAELLKMASPMHDIGKVGIPDAILNKPGKLTKDEFERIKDHTIIGYDLLKNSTRKILEAAAIVAHEHHEKFNGSGYPVGVKGQDIHIFGRITALADVFDALGSKRCYKEPWELERILNLFKDEKNEHFDGKLIDIFFERISDMLDIRKRLEDKSFKFK
jgi:HD-GYP domain-containing protein (c-di-GMP phosphodiesterase class II)